MNYLPESRQPLCGCTAAAPRRRRFARVIGHGGRVRNEWGVPGHFGETRNVIVKVSAQPDKRNREWHGARKQKTTRSLNEEKTSRFNSRVATDADKENNFYDPGRGNKLV